MTTRLADTQFSCVKVASCYRVCGTKSTYIPQICNVSNKMMLTTKIPSYSSHENANLNSEKIEGRGNAARTAQIGHTCPHGLPAGCQLPLWLLIAPGRISSIVFSFYQAASQAEQGGKTSFYQTYVKRGHVYFVYLRRSDSSRRRSEKILFEKCCTTTRTRFHIFFLLPQNETHKLCCINHSAGPRLTVEIICASLFWKI